jgi:transposase
VVRDLVRVRGDLMADLKRAEQRLLAMLLRHGRIWRTGRYWTGRAPPVAGPAGFRGPGVAGRVRSLPGRAGRPGGGDGGDRGRTAALGAPLGETVAKLTAYRGVGELTALTLAGEVVDWRRFRNARSFMCCTGLGPTEYSSGQITRRGHITKAGPQGVRTALVEAAWRYRHTPKVGVGLARRHSDLSAATIARSPTARAPPEHQGTHAAAGQIPDPTYER